MDILKKYNSYKLKVQFKCHYTFLNLYIFQKE